MEHKVLQLASPTAQVHLDLWPHLRRWVITIALQYIVVSQFKTHDHQNEPIGRGCEPNCGRLPAAQHAAQPQWLLLGQKLKPRKEGHRLFAR